MYFCWIFTQARHIAPHDSLLLFNLALVQRLLATSVLRNDQSSLSMVLAAVRELEMAQRHFLFLTKEGDRLKFDLQYANHEARWVLFTLTLAWYLSLTPPSSCRRCADLRSQAEHHITRARKLEDEERSMRERQEKERDALRIKQLEEEVFHHECLGEHAP